MAEKHIGVLDTEGRWAVNNTAIYIPSKDIDLNHTNVTGQDTGRRENGVNKIIWVRRDVRKVNMKWNVLTGNEVHRKLNLMQGKEFTFHYWDNGKKSFKGYCGEINYTIHSGELCKDSGGLYTNITINVVEL